MTRDSRWWRRALLIAALLWVAFSALSFLSSTGSLLRVLRDDVGYTVVVLVATITSGMAWQRGPRDRRRFWALITMANATWFVAEVYWAVANAVGAEVSTPSPGDGLLILSYLGFLVAVGLGFSRAGQATQWRAHVDGAIVCLVVIVAGWQLLVTPQLAEGVSAGSLTLAAYPVLDIAFLVVFVSVGLGGHRHIARPVIAVVVGSCFSLVGDVFLTVLAVHGTEIFDGLIKCIYLPNALLVVVGALADCRPGARVETDTRPVAVDLGIVPTALATAAVLAWALLDARNGTVGIGPFAVTVVLMLALGLRAHLSVRSAQEALRELDRALVEQRRLASTDGLTGLPNRRCIERSLQDAIDHAATTASQRQLVVVILDLDHFKTVNDVHGHGAGDTVLRSVSNRLSAVLRKSDVLARWGGEEFLVFLPEVEQADVFMVVERLRESLAVAPIDIGDGTLIKVTASFGAALVPSQAHTLDEALGLADAQLYIAKAAGRNRTALSSSLTEQQTITAPL